MKPEANIEDEILETGSLEANSFVTDVPNTLVRNRKLFDRSQATPTPALMSWWTQMWIALSMRILTSS